MICTLFSFCNSIYDECCYECMCFQSELQLWLQQTLICMLWAGLVSFKGAICLVCLILCSMDNKVPSFAICLSYPDTRDTAMKSHLISPKGGTSNCYCKKSVCTVDLQDVKQVHTNRWRRGILCHCSTTTALLCRSSKSKDRNRPDFCPLILLHKCKTLIGFGIQVPSVFVHFMGYIFNLKWV